VTEALADDVGLDVSADSADLVHPRLVVEQRDGGEVELADLARRFEGGRVDVLGGERAVEARQRGPTGC
jgi:hypothetical protein